MSSAAKKQKEKADELNHKAEKRISKVSNSKTWCLISSKERMIEEGAELYENAAMAYKVGGFNQEAGDAYMKAGELHWGRLGNSNEASKDFQNAGNCYKKSNPTYALNAFKEAIALFTDNGRITKAAKLAKECGDLYEKKEINDEESLVIHALEYNEQAADLFNMEESTSQSSQCWAKVAELCSAVLQPPDLIRASQIYENLGRQCLSSNLLKYNAKGYFLHATLCHLANGDAVGATRALHRFEGKDYTFSDSKEGRFSRQLVKCAECFDADGLSEASEEYDRYCKLDPWKTVMLLEIKGQFMALLKLI